MVTKPTSVIAVYRLLLLVTLMLSGCGQAIHPPGPHRATDGGPLVQQEVRALWSWAGRKRVPGRQQISRHDLDELVAKVDAAHLNVIFLSVYHNGTAFFEPSHRRFPDGGAWQRLSNRSEFSEAGYRDALSYLLAIRDSRRLDNDPFNDFEVHAWFAVHRGGDQGRGWPPASKTEPYMLNALFPEFRLTYGAYYLTGDTRFVSSAVSVVHQPGFRAYMINLIAGLVEDYQVDGIHLDYIRTGGICFNNEFLDYPGTAYDYPGCQEDYKAWTRKTYGHAYTLWQDTDGRQITDGGSGRVAAWQKRGVGMLVKGIYQAVKAINPEIIVSVASVRNDTSETSKKQLRNGQAAWEWLDREWIDAIFVTAYSAQTQMVVDTLQAVREAVQNPHRRSRVFAGLATFHTRHEVKRPLQSDLVATQVNAVMRGQRARRSLDPPAKGVSLFLDRRLSQAAIQALVTGPFKTPAVPFWGK